MRTTLDLDKKLLDEVVELTGEKVLSKAVNMALIEYIRRKRTQELIALAGHIEMVDNLQELEAMDMEEMERLHGGH